MKLNINANLSNPDCVYQALIELHEGLSQEESQRVNARLILLLINHTGDCRVVLEAIALAGDVTPTTER